MITVENYLGKIGISEDYLTSLISYTAENCFGVAGLNQPDGSHGITALLRNADIRGRTGVRIFVNDGKISAAVHISVLFGTNITAVTDSLSHKIRYTVEDKTGIKLSKIAVYIDGMIE